MGISSNSQIASRLRYVAADELGGMSLQKRLAKELELENTSWRGVLRGIAGLIDRPTCKNLAIKPADELLCSECGEHVDIAYMESADDYHTRYCPNCGAEVCDED